MHENANISFQQQESEKILNVVLSIQPRETAGKLLLLNKSKSAEERTNVTQAQSKIISEREKRLGDALRENLKRRKDKVRKEKKQSC